MLAQALRQLADRGRLTGAVYADDEQHARVGLHVERRGFAEQARDLLGECGVEFGEILPGLEPLHELSGCRHADVRANQGFLEPLPRCVVARIECRRRQLGGERLTTLRERVA